MPILIEFEPCAPLELKIKAKSLAAEARIIKNLELRLKRRYTTKCKLKNFRTGREAGREFNSEVMTTGKRRKGLTDERALAQFTKLQQHRKRDLRQEARATQLARAFLKGMAYSRVEWDAQGGRGLLAGGAGLPPPLVAAIQRLAEKYSDQDKRIVAQRFSEWLADATNWITTKPKPAKGGAGDQTRP